MKAKERAAGATGKCTLFDDSTPEICGGNVKFRMRSEGETKCAAVPIAVVTRNTLWYLERLPALNVEMALRAHAILTDAINRRGGDVIPMRRRH